MELGLAAAEYEELTPAELAALEDVWLERMKRQDRRAGMIVCTIRQALGDKKAKPLDGFGYQEPARKVSADEFERRWRSYDAWRKGKGGGK